MAKSPFSKRDEQYLVNRRALIKWSLAAGAALGVSRSGIFEILEKTAGKGVAFAADPQTCRSFNLVAGNGGLANFQLINPIHGVGVANNGAFAYPYPGQAQALAGTGGIGTGHRALLIGPSTPGANLPVARQLTAFVAGQNETHKDTAASTTELGGNNIYSINAALQLEQPSVVPLVRIGGQISTGTAPGAPQVTQVNNADGIVNLFNSAASRAGGMLAQQRDSALYKAQYEAFAQLNRAANRSTTKASYTTATGAASLLGVNLASRLAITPEDLNRYGINGNTRGNIAAIGRTMIVSVKAFKAGLTNSVVAPAMNDDPHGLWNNMADVTAVATQLKAIFDAFFADLASNVDDNSGKTLADTTVVTITGDTCKDPLSRPGWNDGTPGGHNLVYVWGAGHLRAGWFGNVTADGARGFDANGNDAAYNATSTARFALASIAYAIAKGDERAISQFANGITISGRFGIPRIQ